MKLRLRVGSETRKVELSGQATLEDVYQAISQLFGLPDGSFTASLNGRDALEGDPGTPLDQVGIVSGDLVKVIVTSPDPPPSTAAAAAAAASCSTSTTSTIRTPAPEAATSTDMAEDASHGNINAKELASCEKSEAMDQQSQDAEETDPEMAMETEDPPCSVYEPMLCCDTTSSRIPGSLKTLLDNSAAENPHQALLVVLHVLMMETGFVPKVVSKDNGMPEGWRLSGANFKLTYLHPRCGECEASLTCVTLGPVLMVHGFVPAEENSFFQLQLKPGDYVRGHPQPQFYTSEVFSNLAHLSSLFKDHISYPILATLRHNLGLPALQGILALPSELQLKIMRLLDARSVLSVSETCRDLKVLAGDRLLWRHLYLKDFGQLSQDKKDVNWKKIYRERYQRRREMRQARRQVTFVVPSLMPGPHMPPFHHLPGVRGGDYDVDPFYRGPVYQDQQRQPWNQQQQQPNFPQFRGPSLPRGPFSSGRFGSDSNPLRRYRGGRYDGFFTTGFP